MKECFTEKRLLLVAAIVRVLFIAFGEWQDSHMEVRYTDIDYQVFSDAAALMSKGRSPFERETYRYSPLLALILIPNIHLHPSWGKFLFSAADLIAGHIIHEILNLRGVDKSLRIICTAIWLFNPFTFTIATRGNCEAIVCCIILRLIFCLLKGRLFEAAIWYGIIVHFRIYPIIYVFAILVILDKNYMKHCTSSEAAAEVELHHQETSITTCILGLLNKNRIFFGVISGGIFFLLTGVFYWLYGDLFLFEALLYHLTRTDPRHNFSIYFYHIYLHIDQSFTLLERLLSFVPQFLVQTVLTYFYAKDIPFCFFVQTVAFVAFNKVITAQYFVWFFCLFPLILPWSRMSLRWKGILCMVIWTGAQLHWLLWGYLLEFQGKNVFVELWLASIIFFAANIYVLSMIIWHHSYTPFSVSNFDTNQVKKGKKIC